MSVKKINLTRYQCICELKDCPGGGKPWVSRDNIIPERCNWCGRRTWNGQDSRRNTYITANGKTQRLSEWAKETGISSQLIHYRLKMDWSEQDAVTILPNKKSNGGKGDEQRSIEKAPSQSSTAA